MSIPINVTTKSTAAWLSLIAYTDEDSPEKRRTDVIDSLSKMGPDLNGPYQLLWGPATDTGIMSFIARGADGTLALAFRGTLSDGDADLVGWLYNLLDDIEALKMEPWTYPNDGGSITYGMLNAMDLAVAATDPTTGQNMMSFFTSEQGAHSIMVTGHSLGAGLANLAAVYLANQLSEQGVSVVPFTFAAPTVSDAKFAPVFAQLCPVSYQCINELDIVPMVWNNLAGILTSFPPPGPQLTGWWSGLYDVVWVAKNWIENFGYNFEAVGGPAQRDCFEGVVQGPAGESWSAEALRQHSLQSSYFAHLNLTPPAPGTMLGLRPTRRVATIKKGGKLQGKEGTELKFELPAVEDIPV